MAHSSKNDHIPPKMANSSKNDALLPQGFKDYVLVLGILVPTKRIEASNSGYLQKPFGDSNIPFVIHYRLTIMKKLLPFDKFLDAMQCRFNQKLHVYPKTAHLSQSY